MPWDVEMGRGWRGPYLASVKLSYVDLSNALTAYGTGEYDYDSGSNGVLKNVLGLYDAVSQHSAVTVTASFDSDELVVDWRNVASTSSLYNVDKHEMGRPGSPYLLFVHDIDAAGDNWPLPKLVMVGENGHFDGTAGGVVDSDGITRFSRGDWCTGIADDVVVCL